MSAVLVADTISEIMERMSSLRGFGHNITENIIHHLTVIKGKCSGPAKLDLSDPVTRKWVGQVTDLFYLVDDLSAEAAMLSKQSKMMSLFSACNLTPLLQLKQIEKRLLQEVAPMKNVKMLPDWDAGEVKAETAEGDYVKNEVWEPLAAIIEKKEKGKVGAVTIRGITGMGKAGVAKYVCEVAKVKSGFDALTWIDGAQLQGYYAEFVVDRVNHELEAAKKDSGEEKGFFVVLDDFHNENHKEWLKLVEKLKEVARTSSGGSVLLVTTRSKAVVKFVIDSFALQSDREIRFDTLSDSRSEHLIQGIDETSWKAIEPETREALLDMCGGVFGAAQTMGRLVRSRKPTTESAINQLKEKFVQEMQLKYYDELGLPSWRLRQCFAYSLFILSSQDSVKDEELISLWMAEGFLGHSSASQQPDDMGRECMEEFLRRSIFRVNENREISIIRWRALSPVMVGNDSVCVSMKEDKGIPDNDVRLSLSSDFDVSKDIPRSLFKTNKNVRTFLLKRDRVPNQVMISWLACDAILSAFRRLRVLTLRDLGMKVLPASIEDLKSLRYLDLSCNNLKKLPICIGEFQHLQILLLSHCLKLTELPNDGNHFPSLRHLDVDQCPNLIHMPSALKKLTWLRSLPHFVTSNHNGVGELIHLNEIRGDLEISHLERFKFKGSLPAQAYLKEKRYLEDLTLRWNHDDGDGEQKHSSEDDQTRIMLMHLEPHPNLKRLSVIGYRGNQFAGWLSSLKHLVEISLYNCPKCEYLPKVDRLLINLKRLTLANLGSLQFITVTDKDNGCEELSLERVKISDCPNLTSWWKLGAHSATVFSAISELVVENCPKLVSMPLFPKLDNKLVLDCSNMKPLLNTLRYQSTGSESSPPLSELKNLTIRGCKDLKSIEGWKHLSSLEKLHISNCTGIDLPTEEWEGLQALEDLIIEDMPKLNYLPEGIKRLASMSLITLEIKSCPELTTMLDFGEDLYSFTFILIEDCPKLASLPDSFKANRFFTPLRTHNCPLLEGWN